MRRLKTYALALFLFLICKIAGATHIVGGEISYDDLGGGNYKIRLKVYRDCLNGIPPFDNPAFVTIFDVNSNVIQTLNITLTSSISIPPTNNSPCAPTTSGNACVEEGVYEAIINLPPLAGGYYIAYQRCCRNGTILNLVNPGNVGATYWEHIPGPEVVAVNSSPRFSLLPPIYICANNPISFNHIATDPDGDSLVYSLCTPFDGLGTFCPIIGGGGSCPANNTPPPYISVPFSSPYSSSYPMASNPAINIDFSTGFLNGTPTILGQWVVGVCVSEYRQGTLIGTHHRDFQFNVIPCPFVVTANIISQITTNSGSGTGFCNGYTITYSNNSFNGSSYFWDFGDPNSTTDTSSAFNPTYTFPSVGDYTATLIVDPGSPCADTATQVFHAYPLLTPFFVAPGNQCLKNNNFDFFAAGNFQGNGTFSWNFGPNATPQTASTATVNNVTYNAYGTYSVLLTVAENSCSATSSHTFQIYQSPLASIGNINISGCSPVSVTFPNQSTAGTNMSFLWNFSDGTTSTAQTPTHVFTQPGVYSASLTVITNQTCIDTSNASAVNTITVNAIPSATFNVVSATGLCFNNNNFNFINAGGFQGNTGVLTWNFGSNALPQTASTRTVNNVVYNAPGIYTVSLSAKENGCVDSSSQVIKLYQNPKAAIDSFSAAGCDPQIVTFSNLSTAASAINYFWKFSDGTTSTEKNPIHIFTPPGIYTYTLTVSTTQDCIDSSSVFSVNSITVSPSPIAAFTATPLVASIFEPEITFINTASNAVTSWYYDFGDGEGSNIPNPSHTYNNWGDYYVTQKVTNTYGCPNSIKLLIKILPEFRFWVPNAFTPGKDGLNDVFKPIVFGVENYKFFVFNRWGELIYKTNDTEAGWNGTFEGKECPMDVYVWKCEFRNVVSKEPESHVGHVTLVR